MTAQDRQYMVDVDDANLHQFLAWHRDAEQRGIFQGMSWYSQLKMAWMAARNSLPVPDLKPSRDVLPPAPHPDLVQHGTITGRIGPVPEPAPQQLRAPGMHRTIDPDPFARVKLTGPQQVAMDSLYPLPEAPATAKVWNGEPVRIQAPETRPMRVVPADFELVEGVDVANLPVAGPVEGL
jgi:hypothetical protein